MFQVWVVVGGVVYYSYMCSYPVLPAPSPAFVLAGLTSELVGVLDRLRAEAAAGTVTAVRGPALLDLTETLWACAESATALASHATGELHVTGEVHAAGYASTSQWLQRVVGLPARDARAALARARSLRDEYAATWEAWNAGEITGATARDITMGITAAFRGYPTSVRTEQAPVAERALLALARDGAGRDLVTAIAALRAVADPNGMDAAAMAAYDDQSLTCSPVGAMVTLTAYLDRPAHALLITALDAIVEDWYRTGSLDQVDQPTASDPSDPDSATDPSIFADAADRDARTRSRRRPHLDALALVELARRQVEAGRLGTRHGVRPHLTLLADVDRIAAGLPGELIVPGQTEPTPIPAASVRRILCDADVTAVVTTTARHQDRTNRDTDATGSEDHPAAHDGDVLRSAHLADWLRAEARTVLWVGRATRTAPPRLRRALERRDRHCAFPHCHTDTTRCHAHHVHEWEHGGRTDLDNLVLLCPRHHRFVHEGHWQLTPTTNDPGAPGYWHFTPPPPRRHRP